VYRREGADALKSFIDTRVGMQIPSERILLLHRRIPASGRRPIFTRGPAGVPATPGNYKVKLGSATVASKKPSCTLRTWATTHCWWGRDNLLFKPLQTRFWYGLAAAVAVLCIAGLFVGIITRRALMSRVYSIRKPCRPSFTAT